ncbi:MAG: 16S ribosomal RNA methyltransferase A [Methanomicrobiales archaeon]|nr:16S ribosomal RNA methyltransferase A [Methanomicrobiales archaeon]
MSAPRDQHFLVDPGAIQRIASLLPVSGKVVLEVGPGKGALTRALLDRGAEVVAVELDHNLCRELASTFSPEIASGQLHLIPGDATRVPLPPFTLVVSNLPYSISSPNTFRLLDLGLEEAILMFQYEFARRMLAAPGSPDCGRLSVMVRTYAEVTRCFDLPPYSFSPRPQVHSTVVRLKPRDPPYPIADRKRYADVVRILFSHRRKTVRNGLRSARGIFGGEAVDRMLTSLPEEILSARPERLTLADFAAIAATAHEA